VQGAELAAAFAVIPVFIGSVKAAASLPHSKGFASDKNYAALAVSAACAREMPGAHGTSIFKATKSW
jgi:hypothetical protein